MYGLKELIYKFLTYKEKFIYLIKFFTPTESKKDSLPETESQVKIHICLVKYQYIVGIYRLCNSLI